MRYIKGYKLFENLVVLPNNEFYSSIRISDYYAEEINDHKIDNGVKKRIMDEFTSLTIDDGNLLYIRSLFHHYPAARSSTNFKDKRLDFDLDISEIDDEWFFVAVHINRNGWTASHYKCDQLEGLLILIKDIYSKLF